MRILAFILAVFVVYLSVVPCSDTRLASAEVETSCSGSHSHDQEHSHDGNDDCTPFCVCECCGSFITIPKMLNIGAEDFVQAHLAFNSNFSSSLYNYNHYQGVWHPPSCC